MCYIVPMPTIEQEDNVIAIYLSFHFCQLLHSAFGGSHKQDAAVCQKVAKQFCDENERIQIARELRTVIHVKRAKMFDHMG